MGLFSSMSDLGIPAMTQEYNNEINNNSRDYIGYVKGLDPEALRSHFAGVSTDPATRQAQLQALQEMGALAHSGGNDAQSQAAMFDANSQAGAQERAQRGAIMQNMSARGMGGSGAELAGLLAAQQGGADRSHAGGVQAAADSRRRSLEALGQLGSMAGQLRGQDWGEAAGKAGALDQFSLAKYGAQAGKAGLLGNAYGFDKKVQDENAARAAAQLHSAGSMADSFASIGSGGRKLPSEGGGGGNGMSPNDWMKNGSYGFGGG